MTNEEYIAVVNDIDDYIEHHGILGMKWGIRRYQNPDGSLTALGRKHLADGKTQKAIEKWERQKGSALAKGDVEFARKNMDYLSNQELQAFKERISARTSLDDLKQASRKITADKLQTWANMAQSGSNLLNNGINAYNSAAKIINSITGKKTVPVLKDFGNEENKEKQSIMEIFENGKLVKKQTQYTDKEGNKRDKTENWKDDEKRPETIKNVYDETGKLKTEIRTYTDHNGNTVTDTRQHDTSTKGASSNSYSDQYDRVRNGQYNYNYKTYRNTAEPAYTGPTKALPAPKDSKSTTPSKPVIDVEATELKPATSKQKEPGLQGFKKQADAGKKATEEAEEIVSNYTRELQAKAFFKNLGSPKEDDEDKKKKGKKS